MSIDLIEAPITRAMARAHPVSCAVVNLTRLQGPVDRVPSGAMHVAAAHGQAAAPRSPQGGPDIRLAAERPNVRTPTSPDAQVDPEQIFVEEAPGDDGESRSILPTTAYAFITASLSGLGRGVGIQKRLTRPDLPRLARSLRPSLADQPSCAPESEEHQ